MTLHFREISLSRKVLLSVLAVLALVGPVGFGILQAIPLHGQILHPTEPLPSFDTVSIKRSHAEPRMIHISPDIGARTSPDGALIDGMTLEDLIVWAYNLNDGSQFAGGPAWVRSTTYDIQAKVDGTRAAELKTLSIDQQVVQMKLMMQSVLRDRFGLRISFPTKEQSIYELTVAKGGLKCPKATVSVPAEFLSKPAFDSPPPPPVSPDAPPPLPPDTGSIPEGAAHLRAPAVPMWFLASLLSQTPEIDGRIVENKTGVEGAYQVDLSWSRDDPNHPGPSLFEAIQEQLGLELKRTKGPVEVLTIDSVHPPSEN